MKPVDLNNPAHPEQKNKQNGHRVAAESSVHASVQASHAEKQFTPPPAKRAHENGDRWKRKEGGGGYVITFCMPNRTVAEIPLIDVNIPYKSSFNL